MRQILFKGKTCSEASNSNLKPNNEWVYGFYYDRIGLPTIREFDFKYGNYIDYEIDRKTLGQFTGKPDKNGKEIFEGDIVKVVYIEKRNYQGVKYDNEFEMIETIIYNEKNACFMLEINNEGITMFRPLHDFDSELLIKSIEVIGNKWDNPELLGE